ncbi:MAG: sigma-54 dependent transcriptional regulator [Planctomycetes bacterium]|nr:sigma-54 dependent transcriptional regulator [Planctomycetota bacterium]
MNKPPTPRILIADDEPLFLRTTAELLRKAGFECVGAPDGEAALQALIREPFDLVLSDLNMPGNLKLELLQEGRRRWPQVPLIVITGAPSLPTAIESVRLGIMDYLLKPVKYDDLLSSVRRALAQSKRGRPPKAVGAADGSSVSELVGESKPMQELFDIIERVAETDANVLLTGESGTGKEAVARAIHRRSSRSQGSFQVVDCTAVPETLFESLLFGHAKGSFTGAVKDQVGLLSQADGGTAFIDEIGELPAPLQAKLLRVIQEQSFIPLGKAETVQIDTRFICATNRDLASEVSAGRFRRDLYYRLAVIHIELPPLRRRGDDVTLLARHFLKQLQATKPSIKDFSEQTLDLFKQYSWPGNIRELRNAVEHGLAMARTETITPHDLPTPLQSGSLDGGVAARGQMPAGSRAEALVSAERDYLIALLRENSGNVARSAQQAGMSRQGLHKLLKKQGVDADDYRQ